MNDLAYVLSALMSVAFYIVGVWALWQVVEGVYWIYCKATGKTY